MSLEKIAKEKQILNLALPLLRDIYGDFDIDNDQVDSPDAAILLNKSTNKIGVEITSVDSPKVKAYFNDEKVANLEKEEQLERLIDNGSFTTQPMKKMSVEFKHDYIFKGVIKKSEKHKSYMNAGSYHEMIVVASSEYLEISSEHFFGYHMPWANYLLSNSSFPFDKVIYVCEKTGKSVLIYDKEKPLEEAPKQDKNKELGATFSSGSVIPFGAPFNYNDLFDKEPIILPKSKSKKERKKIKSQRSARKVNWRK
jgi:hypothetical protein